jgi:nucleoid-associated protein YgaU
MPVVRAAAAAAVTVAGAALLWWARPAALTAATPDAAVVRFAAWAAWATAGYLAVGFVTLAAVRLRGADGAVAAAVAAAVPRCVRRAAELLVGGGLAATVVVGAAPSALAEDGGHNPQPAISALDWAHAVRHPSAVVVRPGDSLWRIAARSLRPRSSAPAIAAAWPTWWAANRSVVGPDPNLIVPGQRLRPPPTRIRRSP